MRRILDKRTTLLRVAIKETSMIEAKVSKRWELSVHGNERGSRARLLLVNSMDGDPTMARVTITNESTVIPVADLLDLLRHVETHAK